MPQHHLDFSLFARHDIIKRQFCSLLRLQHLDRRLCGLCSCSIPRIARQHRLCLPSFGARRIKHAGIPRAREALKDPWVAERAAADHHKVTAGLLHHAISGGDIGHVAVSNHRNPDGFLHSGNDIPVRMAAVKLRSRPPMYAHSGRASGFDRLSHLDRVFLCVIPACAYFNRHRFRARGNHCLHDTPRQLRFAHQRAAFSVPYNLGIRTAHIDIQQHMPAIIEHARCLRHDLRLMAKNLVGHRRFSVQNLQQSVGILVLVPQPLGADHFRADQPRPLFAANSTERSVGDPCEGREQKRVF